LGDVLAEDVAFRSPVMWKPYHGRYPTFVILSTVGEVFRDFVYHREFVTGNTWALEFSAQVGDLSVKGIDLIELNDEGLIQDFEVFVRPANGLMALGEEMKRRLTEMGFV
ncbi:MAG: nuclear transport factor 2 family protein, partial [Chloroflexota bacterium]